MSLNRNEYMRIIDIARRLYEMADEYESTELITYSQELFTMAENVIGQQMPPLEGFVS